MSESLRLPTKGSKESAMKREAKLMFPELVDLCGAPSLQTASVGMQSLQRGDQKVFS